MSQRITGPGPLAGIRVLDLTSVFMGPLATACLADLGADVIKVEAPAGDMIRPIGPGGEAGLGPLFQHLNRNKRSVTLDLKAPAGRDLVLRLAREMDVLVYNIRPQAMQRLGLGWETVHALNPRLIYVGTFGYSQRGPYAAEPAFDDLIQAASGLAHAHGATHGVPSYVPATVADRAVGFYAFGAICAALVGRERTGIGQRVDVPMFEVMASFVLGDHLYGRTFDPPRGDFGYPRLTAPTRKPYRTRDGWVCCTVYTDEQWRQFLALIGKPDLFDSDPRFADIGARTRHIDALYALVEHALAERTTAQWQAAFRPANIPIFPVHSFETLLDDPHLAAIGFFESYEHNELGRVRQMACPSEWSNGLPGVRRLAPRSGEHTDEVLAEFGIDLDAGGGREDAPP